VEESETVGAFGEDGATDGAALFRSSAFYLT